MGKKIRSLVSRAVREAQESDGDVGPGQRIPYERWAAKVRQVQDLVRQLEELQAEHEAVVDGHAAAIADMKKTQAEEVTQIRLQANEDTALVELGLTDPYARTAIRAWFSEQDEATRKAGLLATVKSHREALDANASDPTKPAPKLPESVKRLVWSPKEADPPAESKTEDKPSTPRGPTAGPRGDRPNRGKVTTEALMDPSSEAYRKIFGEVS